MPTSLTNCIINAHARALVPGCIALVRKQLRETVPTITHNLVTSFFRLMDSLLVSPQSLIVSPDEPSTPVPAVLASLFTFAVTWSLGGSCDKAGRPVFDRHLRTALAALPERTAEFPSTASLPPGAGSPPGDASVYEWLYEPPGAGGRGWVPWMETMGGEYKCDPDKRFSQIVVPTVDTVRYSYLLDTLLAGGHHVLVVGETGD